MFQKLFDRSIRRFTSCCQSIRQNYNLYWFLATLRIVLTLVPQFGYIHPDEFFQSIEVMSGDVFNTEVSRPWEFNTTFPIRSVILPYVCVGLPLKFLKFVAPYAKYWTGAEVQTPYTLLVLPRLTCCGLSFITDYCLYRICKCYGQNYRMRLVIHASSFVILVYGTRTFSNMMEMVLMSILLCLVVDCMSFSDQVIHRDEYLREKYNKADSPVTRTKLYKLINSLPSHSFSCCFTVATVVVIGVFNRPTFIAFAIPPVFFWLHRGLGSKSVGFVQFHLRMLVFILSCIPGIIFYIITDSYYYGYLTNSEIQELKVTLNNFVVTPLNFLRYNTVLTNLSKHGLHPRYLHLLINVPLLYNVLGIIGITAVIKMIYKALILKQWTDLPRIQSVVSLMTASFIMPVAALSVFPHQEPRFLIPVTLPIVFLYSQHIYQTSGAVKPYHHAQRKPPAANSKMNFLLPLWCVSNVILTIFFGFLHQGGIFPLLKHFSTELQSKPQFTSIHLVTSHMYSLPISLLQLHNPHHTYYNRTVGLKYRIAKQFFTYEMGSIPLDEVYLKINELVEECEKRAHFKKLDYRLYLAMPATLSEEFYSLTYNRSSPYSFIIEDVFYPHLSTEALPNVFTLTECSYDDELIGFCYSEQFYTSPVKYILKFLQQFGLILIRIDKMKHLAY